MTENKFLQAKAEYWKAQAMKLFEYSWDNVPAWWEIAEGKEKVAQMKKEHLNKLLNDEPE